VTLTDGCVSLLGSIWPGKDNSLGSTDGSADFCVVFPDSVHTIDDGWLAIDVLSVAQGDVLDDSALLGYSRVVAIEFRGGDCFGGQEVG
jgi:hypothetical protein